MASSDGATPNRSSIALYTTTIFSAGTLSRRMMSRLEASDTVRILCERRAAVHMDTFAYRYAARFGRYCGNMR
jgi:hypothetical protein